MGIGGGIITKKLLFTVFLIASLSLGGISTASAVENETVETQTADTSTVEENVNTQINNSNIVNEQTETQNTVENNVNTAEKTNNATVATSTTQTSTASQNSVTTETSTQNAAPSANITKQDSVTTESNTADQTSSQNISNIQEEQQAAAGETKTTTTTSFTVTQIEDAASRVKSFIENKKELPNYVTIGITQVQMPEFLKLMTTCLLQLNSRTNNPITLKSVDYANKAAPESLISATGTLSKASYLDIAKRVNAFINANGKLPNYTTTSLGKMRYESLIYMFSKTLNFEKTNNRLPSYVSIKRWSTVSQTSTPVPAELQKYLAATANCQVTNASIKALAASITAGKTTTYAKAVAIFNWVRDKIGYSFYYNTKYGATGTLSKRTGNCVDTSHLLIALTRAAGIPAKYKHVYAKFTSGNWYGHVIAQVYVNGKWYNADATSSRNTFGVINNWYTSSATVKGYYASLPF
ncbi:pseudomurein-binding repeat-containing protein [Methanobacterium oryzae]|uniref:pseudomurein-binding repeat-containing protein n=1 Tax=Methanobacterium oryzae TaxID=69540 RepID=UPI003D1DB14F